MQIGTMVARMREVCDFGGRETRRGWMESTAGGWAVGGGGGGSRVQVPQQGRLKKGL
jgi:hypothetical protein